MKDALGTVQSVLVLGGTSDIAVATVRELASARNAKVVLAGRSEGSLTLTAKALPTDGIDAHVVPFDATDFAAHGTFIDDVFAQYGPFDVVLLAFGVLGDQAADAADASRAVAVLQANYVGAVSVLLPVADKLTAQGRGTIVVLSSVAGERARKDNFIYGSTKAGLDAFAQGLHDSLTGTGVSVTVVRPGFVHSKMTTGMDAAPMSTTPDAVAADIAKGLRNGAHTIWSPGKLRFVFAVLRHLPRPIFRRLSR